MARKAKAKLIPFRKFKSDAIVNVHKPSTCAPIVLSTKTHVPSLNATLIGQYHVLLKKIAQVEADLTSSEQEKKERIDLLRAEVENLGGIEAYQKASKEGESAARFEAFNASKWVLAHPMVQERTSKLRILDVGAICNHYKSVPNISCVAIDLHPQDESVIPCDLLQFKDAFGFDAVVLSLVLNFDGDPRKRGHMIKHAVSLLAPSGLGLCFIVLPLACINNSRYFARHIMTELMKLLGLVEHHFKSSKSLAFFVYKKELTIPPDFIGNFGRRSVRLGPNRNNFCILLQRPSEAQGN